MKCQSIGDVATNIRTPFSRLRTVNVDRIVLLTIQCARTKTQTKNAVHAFALKSFPQTEMYGGSVEVTHNSSL